MGMIFCFFGYFKGVNWHLALYFIAVVAIVFYSFLLLIKLLINQYIENIRKAYRLFLLCRKKFLFSHIFESNFLYILLK